MRDVDGCNNQFNVKSTLNSITFIFNVKQKYYQGKVRLAWPNGLLVTNLWDPKGAPASVGLRKQLS